MKKGDADVCAQHQLSKRRVRERKRRKKEKAKEDGKPWVLRPHL